MPIDKPEVERYNTPNIIPTNQLGIYEFKKGEQLHENCHFLQVYDARAPLSNVYAHIRCVLLFKS